MEFILKTSIVTTRLFTSKVNLIHNY